MTVYIAFAVRDRALNAYMQPFFVPSVGVAVRSFADEVNRAESPFHAHPEDFDLYQIGMYDDANGRLEAAAEPRQVAIGKEHKTKL